MADSRVHPSCWTYSDFCEDPWRDRWAKHCYSEFADEMKYRHCENLPHDGSVACAKHCVNPKCEPHLHEESVHELPMQYATRGMQFYDECENLPHDGSAYCVKHCVNPKCESHPHEGSISRITNAM